MRFGRLRAKSVRIGNDRTTSNTSKETSSAFRELPKGIPYFPDGIRIYFSIISDLYGLFTKFVEFHLTSLTMNLHQL